MTSSTSEVVRSFDGTALAACRLGTDDGALPLLLVNAIGADLTAWRGVLTDVVRERHVIAWDHRGLHESGAPVSGRVDVQAQTEDAIAIADHFDVRRFAIAAWSSGVRVALEIAARYPEMVAGMFLVSGAHGSPWSALLRMEVGVVLPRAALAARFAAGPLGAAFRKLAQRPELPGLVRQSGMVGATADTRTIVDLLRALAQCDFAILLRSYGEIMSDVADDIIDDIRAPARIVIGDRDPFTSPALIEALIERLPVASYEIYEGATHYVPLEFPAKLSIDLRSFLGSLAA